MSIKGTTPVRADFRLFYVGVREGGRSTDLVDLTCKENGLIATGASRDCVFVRTGIFMGMVSVEYHSGPEPGPLREDEWDDIAQLVLTDPPADIGVSSFMEGPDTGPVSPGQGPIVVRVAARGRDVDPGGIGPDEGEVLTEFYRIDFWPQRPGDTDAIWRLHRESISR